MATNTGVVLLARRKLNGQDRLDIEDNIGEGIHIHYKNFRLDYTVEELLSFAKACEEALNELGVTIQRNGPA
jgi:hypothetical protein|tara:strand:- start:906 stop:1121 length:216 start_codon:yes stop_codon:yes gene_type:complete